MTPARAFKLLLEAALAYPGAWEDHPWGETVVKVGKKVFVFLGKGDGGFGLSCKLPRSSEAALTMFSFAAPTGYGLGKSGWVSAQFGKGEDVPGELFVEWIEESYGAVAPAKTVKLLAKARAPQASKQAPQVAKKKARVKKEPQAKQLPARKTARKRS